MNRVPVMRSRAYGTTPNDRTTPLTQPMMAPALVRVKPEMLLHDLDSVDLTGVWANFGKGSPVKPSAGGRRARNPGPLRDRRSAVRLQERRGSRRDSARLQVALSAHEGSPPRVFRVAGAGWRVAHTFGSSAPR